MLRRETASPASHFLSNVLLKKLVSFYKGTAQRQDTCPKCGTSWVWFHKWMRGEKKAKNQAFGCCFPMIPYNSLFKTAKKRFLQTSKTWEHTEGLK